MVTVAVFSFGETEPPDISAPSACIDRAVAEAASARNLNSTDGGGGTSYGTVHVAAAAAISGRLADVREYLD